MLTARIGIVLLLVSAASFAESATGSSGATTTVCDRYRQADIVFTGSAEDSWITLLDTRKSPIHKRSEKSKRVRFLVREWFKGRRQDTVELWLTPSECDLIIEPNQTYLIYAKLDKQNGRTETNACMGTTAVGTAASDLSYLTAAQHGPAQATRISGNAGSEGLNIQAKSGIDIRYAVTDGAGKFAFDGLQAGDWDLSVNGGSPTQVHLEPNSCVVEDLRK